VVLERVAGMGCYILEKKGSERGKERDEIEIETETETKTERDKEK